MPFTGQQQRDAAFATKAPTLPSANLAKRKTCVLMSQKRPRGTAAATFALSIALAAPSAVCAAWTSRANILPYEPPSATTTSDRVNRVCVAAITAPDIGSAAGRDPFEAPFVNTKRALVSYKLGRDAEVEMLWRMGVSITCGAIIGMERRAASAPAGVRTLALVSLGASVFTLTSLLSLSGDSARMGAAVSTGIGFLGAGAINHDTGARRSQRQLVTAASVWISASLGVAASSGLKFLALVAALVTVGILRWDNILRQGDTLLRRRFPALRALLSRIANNIRDV